MADAKARRSQGPRSRITARPRELDLAKAYLIGSFPLRLDTSGKITAADVQRVAARYMEPGTFSSVTVSR